MTELTTTSYAVLGLLALRDWTTYELAKQMQRSVAFVWPRAERKLYDEPKRLVAAGYAVATKDMVGRRPRTTYAITDAGRAALRAWLDTPIAPPVLESEGMLRVLFGDQGSVEQLRASLLSLAEHAAAGRAQFATMTAGILETGGAFPARRHVNALGMRYMIDYFDHLARFAAWALDETSTWDDMASAAETWRAQAEAIFREAVAGEPSGHPL